MSKEQTAIEWLISQIKENALIKPSLEGGFDKLVDQAKVMEKEQIENAYWDGGQDIPCSGESCKQYYNNKFQ